MAVPLPRGGHGDLAQEMALVGIDDGQFAACSSVVEQRQLLLKKGEEHRVSARVEAAAQLLGHAGQEPTPLLRGLPEPSTSFFLAATSSFGDRPARLPSAKPEQPLGIALITL